MDSQLTIRLPSSLSEDLDRAARLLRRKRSEVVRLALEEYLGEVLPADAGGPETIDWRTGWARR